MNKQQFETVRQLFADFTPYETAKIAVLGDSWTDNEEVDFVKLWMCLIDDAEMDGWIF
jgi:hypothetical protein